MNIIWAVREICAEEQGFENLFDREKSYKKLIDLTDNKEEAIQFASLIYGCARKNLLELIHDVYNYEEYLDKIYEDLIEDGMNLIEARHAMEKFFEAFGFPNYKSYDKSKEDIIVKVEGNFRTEYKGEVRNGKEHGVGVKISFYNEKWYNYEECVWVNGVMCGYNYGKAIEFDIFEDETVGFTVNNYRIGKIRVFAHDGEEFDDFGKRLNIQ